jgi:hypothetical protein
LLSPHCAFSCRPCQHRPNAEPNSIADTASFPLKWDPPLLSLFDHQDVSGECNVYKEGNSVQDVIDCYIAPPRLDVLRYSAPQLIPKDHKRKTDASQRPHQQQLKERKTEVE